MALLTLAASMGAPFDAELAEREPGAGLPGNDELLSAVQVLQRIASICLPESFGWNPLEALTALVEGDCDCVPLTFGYGHFQNRGLRFGPIPAMDLHRVPRPVLGGTGMAVSARRPHVEISTALARFAGSGEVQAELWPRHGGQPAHREAWCRLSETDPFYRDTFSSMTTAYVRPRCIGWNQFQSAAGNAIAEWLGVRFGSPSSLVEHLRELWHEATCPVREVEGYPETGTMPALQHLAHVGDADALRRHRKTGSDAGQLS